MCFCITIKLTLPGPDATEFYDNCKVWYDRIRDRPTLPSLRGHLKDKPWF